MPNVIRLGDATSHGGKVESVSATYFTVDGIPVACVGDACSCDLQAWPKQGDPYNEIYKLQGKWFALFREDWINPSNHTPKQGGGTFARTCRYLDQARQFHQEIASTYHPNSYAHYGADGGRQSFGEVVWEIRNCADPSGWRDWPIISDTKQGKLELVRWDVNYRGKTFAESPSIPSPHLSKASAAPISNPGGNKSIHATILPASAPGDQTVPARSADHQLNSGMFKGVFRQTGYEHQSSYKDPQAIASTLYSIVRIAQNASWKC